MEISPKEILADNSFLESFSKKDIQKIILAATENQEFKSPFLNSHFKLLRQEFNIEDNKTTFILEDIKGNKILKTANEIALDRKIIKNL